MKTIRELYCERHGIAIDRFERELLGRSLHRRAKPFYWMLRLNREYAAPDLDFVRTVGDLRNWRDFQNEVADFRDHPRNRTFLRAMLRQRISSRRLQDIVRREVKDHVPS